MERLVLLTGVTGHSGRYAIERLAKRRECIQGMRFRAVVRPSSDTAVLTNSGLPIEILTGDLNDDAFVANALCGVDTALNIYGIIGDPAKFAKLAAAAHVRRLISVHTTGMYSKYKSAGAGYARTEEEVKRICQEGGVSLTILRPTMIYGGPDDCNVITFVRMMDRLPVMPVVSDARYALQPVHRQDLGHAYADVLIDEAETFGKHYDISGEAPITLRDMLTIIADQLGKPARFLSVPYCIAITGAWGLYIVSFGKVDYREKVQRLVEPRAYAHDDATRDFGYAPMPFDIGVSGEIKAYITGKQA